MNRIVNMSWDLILAAGILFPVFWIMEKRYIHNIPKTVLCYCFAVYLSAVYSLVGLPDICYVRFATNINLVPFAYMFSDYKNSLLNVLLFVPMGFFLPILRSNFRSLTKTFFFGFGISLLIETLQIFTYRASDINDLMTNSLGTIIGWMMAVMLRHFVPTAFSDGNTPSIRKVCAAAFGVMFFIHPILSKWIERCI